MKKVRNMTRTCDFCKKDFFIFRTRKDGTPNGITMQMKDGSYLTVCHDCICDEAQYSKLLGVVNNGKQKDSTDMP